jgi:hypothetical protein
VITSSFSLNGGRVTGTDLRTDGVQTKNTLWGAGFGRGPYSLSMEAVREYEVVTNLYDVTQGRQSAGAINVVTQSGTNEHAGSVFGYFVNSGLTTRTSWASPRSTGACSGAARPAGPWCATGCTTSWPSTGRTSPSPSSRST